ncbi:hypothetical protein JBE27_53915, partial [Streptomyces albiflaviniger]|nr:hypothetical protein [Streptomyces albiflaviniger]
MSEAIDTLTSKSKKNRSQKKYYWQLRSENRESLRRMETRLDDSFTETTTRLNDIGRQVQMLITPSPTMATIINDIQVRQVPHDVMHHITQDALAQVNIM